MTRGELAEIIERYLNDMATAEAKAERAKRLHVTESLLYRRFGAQELAERLAIKCDCFTTRFVEPPRPRVVCKCKPKPVRKRRR